MTDGLWVFGYGSLMWRPGFPARYRVAARVTGFCRRFCVLSVHHRGTEHRPGLVLGLDRGGSCDGVAYWVPQQDAADVRAYLRAREQVNGVYRETYVGFDPNGPLQPIEPPDPRRTSSMDAAPILPADEQLKALTYVAERAHPSYIGVLPLPLQARIVRGARGLSGHNVAYVANTACHLRGLGIIDRDIERLGVMLGGWLNRRLQDPPFMPTSAASANSAAPPLPSTLRCAATGGIGRHIPLPQAFGHQPLPREQRKRFSYRSIMT
ncbi:MAG: gamma-glutamylcyclotransferase [Pseudomonadota bacterium]